MSQNFKSPGKILEVTAPYALSTGEGCKVGSIFGVSTDAYAVSVAAQIDTDGIHSLPKTSAQAYTVGQELFWDDTNGRVDSDGSLGMRIGVCAEAAANPSSTCLVKLEPIGLPRVSTATVAAAGSAQGDAGALPLEGGFVLVSAADATKGVILPAAVAGKQVTIKNNVAAVLKVYPATGDGINAIAVNSAISMAALSSATFTAYDATTWFTNPLVPS